MNGIEGRSKKMKWDTEYGAKTRIRIQDGAKRSTELEGWS